MPLLHRGNQDGVKVGLISCRYYYAEDIMLISTQFCSISVESGFESAVPFEETNCRRFAVECLRLFSNRGLRSSQIVVERGDEVFRYGLGFTHFNGNWKFNLDAEKVSLSFQNILGTNDMEIALDCLAKTFEELPLPPISKTTVLGSVHAIGPSVEVGQQYLLRYANPGTQVVSGGAIAYILTKFWPEEVRFTLEGSKVFPGGVFMNWLTENRSGTLNREKLLAVRDAFVDSVTRFGLEFKRGNQQ